MNRLLLSAAVKKMFVRLVSTRITSSFSNTSPGRAGGVGEGVCISEVVRGRVLSCALGDCADNQASDKNRDASEGCEKPD